jgi:hypothetical protein
MTHNFPWPLAALSLMALIVGCSPDPVEFRLPNNYVNADGFDIFSFNVVLTKVDRCQEEFICVRARPEGEKWDNDYVIIDPAAESNAERPDLEVLRQLKNIALDNMNEQVRVSVSGTVIVAIQELAGKQRFVQGVKLVRITSSASDKARIESLREMFKRNDESRSASGSPREMTPTEEYCGRATSLSQGFAEMVAKRLQVSVDSVRLIRAEPQRVSGCIITLDTPIGPQSCQGGTIYYDGSEYWIGGYCS